MFLQIARLKPWFWQQWLVMESCFSSLVWVDGLKMNLFSRWGKCRWKLVNNCLEATLVLLKLILCMIIACCVIEMLTIAYMASPIWIASKEWRDTMKYIRIKGSDMIRWNALFRDTRIPCLLQNCASPDIARRSLAICIWNPSCR